MAVYSRLGFDYQASTSACWKVHLFASTFGSDNRLLKALAVSESYPWACMWHACLQRGLVADSGCRSLRCTETLNREALHRLLAVCHYSWWSSLDCDSWSADGAIWYWRALDYWKGQAGENCGPAEQLLARMASWPMSLLKVSQDVAVGSWRQTLHAAHWSL